MRINASGATSFSFRILRPKPGPCLHGHQFSSNEKNAQAALPAQVQHAFCTLASLAWPFGHAFAKANQIISSKQVEKTSRVNEVLALSCQSLDFPDLIGLRCFSPSAAALEETQRAKWWRWQPGPRHACSKKCSCGHSHSIWM